MPLEIVNLVLVVFQVAGIDVKKESPVGHGQIICFSIYCGPGANFGDGKNRLWVDVLDGGEDVLKVFKRYFEDSSIQKVSLIASSASHAWCAWERKTFRCRW